MNKVRNTPPGLIAACALLLLATVAHAQNYPAKPIRFIVPFPAGGPGDLMGRTAADRLSRAWSAQVVVDNRSGAGGNIGAEACAKAPADGYTMCIMTSAHAIAPSVYRKLPFDPVRDFSHVTLMGLLPSMLTAHPALPARTVKDVIALAKAKPGEMTYASTGSGTTPHILMELFKIMTGVNVVHVPYKGQAPAVVDQMAGQIQIAFNTAITVLPYVQAGKLRPIAISTKERFPPMPELPTVDEGGVKGFEGSSWQSVVMPAHVPRDIVNKLYQELAAMLKAKDVREKFLSQGAFVSGMPPDEFTAFVRLEVNKWAKVAVAAKLKAD
jgi:tripartite-type tricarboxylate transporter receptor subunit TctC